MRNLFNRHFDMLVRVLAFDQDVAKENSRIFGFGSFSKFRQAVATGDNKVVGSDGVEFRIISIEP